MISKEEISGIISKFNQLNALIIGDVMIDSYIWGKTDRISPEAPVPVVSVESRQERLGGAANVALNVKSLSANPIICTVIGNDSKGDTLIKLFEENNLSTKGIIRSNKRITTTKFRVIANKHQLLRIDEEIDSDINHDETLSLLKTIENILKENKIDVVIFEDYDKGVITPDLIENVVKLSKHNNIPTIVDPKKRNFNLYKHVSLFKPNLKELKEGLKIDFESNDIENIKKAVEHLESKLSNEFTLLTLSELGVMISENKGDKKIIPAHLRNISDVSGAGDTVISVAALCLALKTDINFLASLANLAGGIVCEYVGVVSIEKNILLEEALKVL